MYSSLFRVRALAVVVCVSLCQFEVAAEVLINEIMYHSPPAVPEVPAFEWVELLNRGSNSVDLTGWRLDKGVAFTFTNVALAPGGCLVVAASRAAFLTNHPGITNVVGDWTGKLRNRGETVRLVDATGREVDRVSYAAEGDWAERRVGEPFPGQPGWWRGWQWVTPADGGGKSIELRNPVLAHDQGQNWAPSGPEGGTPGQPNSMATNNIPPMILEVTHYPAVPQSSDPVTVTARIVDEGANPTVSVHFRVDGAPAFEVSAMLDDGQHGDGLPGDGLYGAVLPPRADKTVVEFYVEAVDGGGRRRTCPGPTDELGTQGANALYQVDDFGYTGGQSLYRFIVTAGEWAAWLGLMDNTTGGRYSDAAMNGALVRVDGTGTEVRYAVAIRNRGAGTRAAHPHNFHLSIPDDRPLQGVRKLNFNTRTVHAQVAGNALFVAAGLLNAYGAPVQVRVNGNNLANATPTGSADSYQFGSYYCFEPYDSDWAASHIPQDAGGNIYQGYWYLDNVKLLQGATLDYLGTNVESYRRTYSPTGAVATTGAYQKQSNTAEDDWSDLIDLTYVLSTNTPDSNYVQAISRRVDIEQWLRHIAVNSLILNMETTLATGVGDDYMAYCGVLDPRFRLLNHDNDTLLGQGEGTPAWTRSIFKAADLPVLSRFLKHPEIAPRYFAILKEYADTLFVPERIGAELERQLKDFVPAPYIQSMKDAAERRRTNVLAQIPMRLSVQSPLAVSNGYPRATSALTTLSGTANAILTRQVLVNGAAANYVPWQGAWSAGNVALHPGINRVLIQAMNTNGVECGRTHIDIWYDDGSAQVAGGAIGANVLWTALEGPYHVVSNLVINSGATLAIEPGTTVYLGPGVSVAVADGGRLVAEGTANAPIRFAVLPGSGARWGGITINGSASSPETRIAYAHFEGNSNTCLQVSGGTIYLAHSSFGTTDRTYLSLDGASFLVTHCSFPSGSAGFELVHGTGGIKAGGRGIIRNCFFGKPVGYNDVIDFTGGNRNYSQPILQLYQNVFTGATDDVLDLDGTDAWIEGNLFLHCHRNGAPDSSSAISGGSSGPDTSEVTVIGNLFFDCDHVATAKEGNFYTFLNNTMVRITQVGGMDTASAVFNLRDTEPSPTAFGAGIYAEGNIIVEAAALVRNYDPAQSTVVFNRNLLPSGWSGPGSGNSTNAPRLSHVPTLEETQFGSWEEAQAMWQWLSLGPGSPGRGTGPNGRDMGGVIPLGASVSGEPDSLTSSNSARLEVGVVRTGNGIPVAGFPQGSGYTHYKWRLNDGVWSAETPVGTPVVLSNLSDGTYWVEVTGKRDSGWYQDAVELEGSTTRSKTWTVQAGLSGLRINEILARNGGILVTNGESPDLIELFNAGQSVVNLSGKGLTDNPLNPYKFIFPSGMSLAPGQYLLLYGDVGPDPARYTGFGLKQEGDVLYLYDSMAEGGGLREKVEFGPQLANLSIGRLPGGQWGLCQPTPGSANKEHPTGDVRALRINEWLAAGTPAIPDDFVELYNPDALPGDMGGCYLSDAPDGSPALHRIRPLSFIAGGGFFVFKADGNTGQGPEHLGFSLRSEGGGIGLFGPDLGVIDRVFYGPQSAGISEGRSPNGAAALRFFSTPTPGAGNPGGSPDVTVVTTTYRLLELTNQWRYYAMGAEPAGTWKNPQYADTGWPLGNGLLGVETTSPYPYPAPILTPLPLTNGQGSNILTYYFRTTFVVPTNLAGFAIDTGIYLDDGAVFYLNGNEAGRLRLPAGAITYSTLATNQPSEGVRESLLIPASALLAGTNTLAVEVHQSAVASSDIVFGMTLSASRTVYVTNYQSLVINEVFAGNGPAGDAIELYNPGNLPLSLAGYRLTDDLAQPERWVFPAGVILAAGERLVVRFDSGTAPSTTTGPTLNTGFALNSAGDAVYLLDPTSSLADAVVFGPQAADFSIGRIPDGTARWTINLPTLGSQNIEATVGDPTKLRINEWAASVAGGPDWFEIYNPNAQPVALGGLYLTDKLSNRTKHPIAALSYIGVSTNAFRKFIADGDTAQGPQHVSFSLDAGTGEALGLFPPGTGPAIDTVVFGPQTTGISEGRLPDGSTNRVFLPVPTPGEANWLPLSNVFINEVLTHTDLPLEDAVELYNAGATAVNIGGWYLSDSQRELFKFKIPDNTILAAGGYKVFYEYQFNADPLEPESFAFSSAKGDEVWLIACDTNGLPTGYRDRGSYGPQFNGVSFGRFLTSQGAEFTAQSALTLGTSVTRVSPTNQLPLFRTGTGAPNAYPRVGPVVISEIMYSPAPLGTNENVQEEYIELHNLTGVAVPLFDIAHPTNGWRLTKGVEFVFSTNHALPPLGYLVVVGFNPATNAAVTAAFRAKYGAASLLAGPWSGKLANSGEVIELQAPDAPQTVPGPDWGLVPYVTVDRVAYSPAPPWPANTDGLGLSLQRVTPTAYGNEPTNWCAAVPNAGSGGQADSDGDGMPDEWEEGHGLNKYINDAGLDPDGDGLSNLQEFLAGTDPQDRHSYLRIAGVSDSPTGIRIEFEARAGRTYSVLYNDRLGLGPWQKLADVPAPPNDQPAVVFDSSISDGGGRFYRLVTPALP
ncbi:MAG TPA: lamin tail domain-containing protein [Candidatus Paceibacterota bacterium]|nr:lamin tail domain-containing protein [Candidatus Paceibacterota bacterium]